MWKAIVTTFEDRRNGAWVPDAARSVGAVWIGEQVEQRAELGRREPAEVLAKVGVDDRSGFVEPLAPGRGEPRGDEAPVVRIAIRLDEPSLRHAVQEPADVRPLRDEALADLGRVDAVVARAVQDAEHVVLRGRQSVRRECLLQLVHLPGDRPVERDGHPLLQRGGAELPGQARGGLPHRVAAGARARSRTRFCSGAVLQPTVTLR